jgi:hypothetical protein
MIKLRHGFKSEANRLAVTLRSELHLVAHAPLCPWKLAEYLSIRIRTLSDVEEFEPEGVQHLLGSGQEIFSAVTIFGGSHGCKRLVVHNDAHARPRQAANIAHELAHAILCHPPTPPFIPDEVAEAEAKCLGPTLLVPNEAAMFIMKQGMTEQAAQSMYGVSRALLQMRINTSGARIRMKRRNGGGGHKGWP